MKNTSNVYLCCPLSVPKENLLEMVDFLTSLNISLTYWNREYYVKEYYELCDVVIFALPDNSFKYTIEDLSVRVKREFKEAIKDKKPMLLIYKSLNGYKLYKLKIEKGFVIGTISSSEEALNILLKNCPQYKKSFECFPQFKLSEKLRNLLFYV